MKQVIFRLEDDTLDLFNRADTYVCKQHGYDDFDEIDNIKAKQLWESTFDVTVELEENSQLFEPQFGNIVFHSEESYTMFVLKFSGQSA
jgi:hypothetical protein